MKKIAVFSTSHIQSFDPRYEGQEPCSTDGENTFYSTGALESANEQGYTIYVVSTRQATYPTDAWWVQLVGEMNIHLTPKELPPSAKNRRLGHDDARRERYFLPWRELFAQLEIPFPEGEYLYWLPLSHDLQRFGLTRGSSFKSRREC